MMKLLTTGALALAMTGFALGAAAPAQAAMYSTPGVTVHVSGGQGPGSWWWRQHHHRRHQVCNTFWRHHHRVTVCKWAY